jgi:hypothetical protein
MAGRRAGRSGGRRRVNFVQEAEILKRRSGLKIVIFLTSPHRLLDALEALKLLEKTDGPWWNKLRRAAALYVLCCEEERARTPEKPDEGRVGKRPKPYSPPRDRQIEINPGLFRGLDRIAREKGVDLGDLVAGLAWEFVRGESEKLAKRHEYPREGSTRDVLF